ncbi:hypothetical protein [Gracilibacillus sp. YIM 98692]|uniref:hypothetical protein n=1 Tax=Gracilibacillus sp. YIM 98692 TaxID=2663532 RepID=UPI0013D11B2E|nr:hypothetical protein [Gracilibacillus sp. YIM 98692]
MVQIRFQQFEIENLKETSAVFSGDNFQHNFSSILKKKEGHGSIIGNRNIVFNNIHTVRNNKSDTEDE